MSSGGTLQQNEACGFTDRDAAAFGVERPARLLRCYTECAKAEKRRSAQRVRAANDRCIANIRPDHSSSAAKDLCCCSTGRRYNKRRTRKIENRLDEPG